VTSGLCGYHTASSGVNPLVTQPNTGDAADLMMLNRNRRHQSTACALCTLFAVALSTHTAVAAAPDPSAGKNRPVLRYGIDDGTPLRTLPPSPTPSVAPDPYEEPAKPGIDTTLDRDRDLLIVHGRWLSAPAVALDLFYDDHQPLSQPSLGIAWETGPTDERVLALELAWLPLTPRYGNWLARGSDPSQASYVESRMHMIAFDVTYRRQWEIAQIFRIQIGAGLGVAALIGNVQTDDVLPDCTAPVDACGHWPSATRSTLALPTRILPVLHLTAGMEVDLGDTLVLRLSAGLKNVVYFGASLGVQL